MLQNEGLGRLCDSERYHSDQPMVKQGDGVGDVVVPVQVVQLPGVSKKTAQRSHYYEVGLLNEVFVENFDRPKIHLFTWFHEGSCTIRC